MYYVRDDEDLKKAAGQPAASHDKTEIKKARDGTRTRSANCEIINRICQPSRCYKNGSAQ